VAGRECRVASEYFAISGDVHLILGHVNPRDYDCGTPDGKLRRWIRRAGVWPVLFARMQKC